MAKKQKRQVSSGNRKSTAAETTRARSAARSAEFNPDYSHVLSDLKRIAIMAGSFFIILIVLAFVLN